MIIHAQGVDQALSVLEIGVAEPTQPPTFRVTLTKQSNTFDIECVKKFVNVFGVNVVGQVANACCEGRITWDHFIADLGA